jgi:hypothetical protein
MLFPSEDMQDLKALMEGSLNQHECTDCGTPFVIEVPMYYRNAARNMLICCITDKDTSLEKAKEHLADISQKITEVGEIVSQQQEQANDELPTPEIDASTNENTESESDEEEIETPPPECRLVFSRRRFIEKITLLEKGYNDRLVEYIKYQLINNAKEDIDAVRTELLYDFSCEDATILRFLLFDRETGRSAQAAHIPASVYQDLEETFEHNTSLQEELESLFPDVIVSVDNLAL